MLIVLLLFSLFQASAPPQASVRALFVQELDEERMEYVQRQICTVSSINKIGLFLTANHCVGGDMLIGIPGEQLFRATIVFQDEAHDVAVLFSRELQVEPLTLASEDSNLGEYAYMIGYPLGLSKYFFVSGNVASVNVPVVIGDHDYGPHTFFNMPVCGGFSGSPIFNSAGELMSITQIGPGTPCAPLTGGIPFIDLQAIVGHLM